MDDAIIDGVRRRLNLLIGAATAERVKKTAGAARLSGIKSGETTQIKGRDVARGVPLEVEVERELIVEALSESIAQIVHAVRHALEGTAPEIAGDIIDAGIVMTGGGSLLPGIDA